jgi:hypothetical protein
MSEKDDEFIPLDEEVVEQVPTTTAIQATETTAPVERRRPSKAKAAAPADAAPAAAEVVETEADDAPALDDDGTARQHPILTNAELKAAKEKARAKVEADRKRAAMKAVEDAETSRLREEEGLTTGDGVKDQIVMITLNLAQHSQNITVNGRAYWHGQTYKVPRHVADSLREMQARGWRHQDEIDGKSLTQHYQAERTTSLRLVGGRGVHVGNAPLNYGLRAGPEDHARRA